MRSILPDLRKARVSGLKEVIGGMWSLMQGPLCQELLLSVF